MKKDNTKNETSQNFYKQTADIHNVSERYVRMVIEEERNNAPVKATFEMLVYGSNKLVEAVKRLVDMHKPLTTTKTK